MLATLDLSLSMLDVSNLTIFWAPVIRACRWGSVQFVTMAVSTGGLVRANNEGMWF